MSKKSIRSVACVCMIMLTVLLFAGCIQNQTPPTTATPTTTEAVQDDAKDKYAPDDSKVYEISSLSTGYAEVDPESYIVKLYNEKFNVKLSHVFVDPTKWDELLNLKFATNELPDIIYCRSTDRLAKYVSQKLLTELPVSAIEKYAPDLYNTILRDAPNGFNVTKINGINYGIPFLNGGNAYHDPIVWRGDWLENVGISKVPETLEEYEEAFIKFVKNDPDKNNKDDTYALSNAGMMPIFGAFGVIVFPLTQDPGKADTAYWKEKDGQLVFGAVQPEAKEALSVLAKWYQMGLIDPEFVTGENNGGYWALSHDFVNGKIGYTSHGLFYHWAAEDPEETGMADGVNIVEMKKIYPDGNFSVVFGNPPIGPDGVTRGAAKGMVAPGISFVFSKNLENEPDKLGKILQMFNWPAESSENWLINYAGYEGEHYSLKQQGKNRIITMNPGVADDPATSNTNGFAQFFYWLDTASYEIAVPSFSSFAKINQLDKFGVENLLQAPLASASKYSAELDKMRMEAYFEIITGKQTIDYFDTFVKNWRNAGGDQLTKEANEWYNSVR